MINYYYTYKCYTFGEVYYVSGEIMSMIHRGTYLLMVNFCLHIPYIRYTFLHYGRIKVRALKYLKDVLCTRHWDSIGERPKPISQESTV